MREERQATGTVDRPDDAPSSRAWSSVDRWRHIRAHPRLAQCAGLDETWREELRWSAMSGAGPEVTVERQVEAYNTHDLDRFCACYSDDVVVVDGDGNQMLGGMEAFRERYRQQFAGDATGEVVARVSAGPWVVDREIARLGEQTLEGLVAYRVRGELIDRVHFLFDVG
jgi:hypothetical protein